MKKALYLFTVFLMPVISALIPLEHFQDLWVWLYVPFAVAYGTYIWFQPDVRMMVLVSFAPIVFLSVVLVVFPFLAAMDAGAVEGLKFLAVVALFAVPTSVVIGSVYVLLAYAIYALFRRYDLLPGNS
ncbi:hypothetical protein [Microbulbifer sp. ALW1]|uniref:hypothetical protein n=1 Tax=Microbulbifer sp. (strain ALW1) TaxID=1516059 RepID=UPI0013578982|nr:hypothetical protein [Microbulbifer sp. ALW1]